MAVLLAVDTIFALSTGFGASGIAVVRLSGPRAFEAAARLCGPLPEARRAGLRVLRDPADGGEIDSGLVLAFPAPTTFTGEDLVELQVHGSLAVIRRLLRVLGEMPGLRAAEAGEFTHRAFLNGRMDLIEAEALGDLLAAETEVQASFARRYQNRLRQAAQLWRSQLIDSLALVEAYIDFADEDDVGSATDSPAEQEIRALRDAIASALEGLGRGERIRRGFRVAIIGAPNAGKSSLLNALAARDVAITSPIPGTTRDAIEVHLDLDGFPVLLTDTAGIRATTDEIEALGIDRARRAAAAADLVLQLVAPGEVPLPDIAGTITLRSKGDLIDSDALSEQAFPIISARTGQGISELVGLLKERAHEALAFNEGEGVAVAHARQAAELRGAVAALDRALACPVADLEVMAENLRLAARFLDRLTGRIDHEEVLGAIFSRFCIGK